MRILHAIHSLDPRSGGPSAMIRELVRAQVDAGHDVTLLANTVQSAEPWLPADDYARQITGDQAFAGSEVVLAKSYGRRRPWNRFAYSPEARRCLNRRLCDTALRPDVVHVHCVFSHITTTAASCAYRAGVPYVLSPHGALDSICYELGNTRLKRMFARMFLRHDVPRAALLHATSDTEAASLQSWTAANRIRVVPLGVSAPDFDRATAAEPLLTKFPQLRGRRVVLFLSRVAPKKRPEMLPAALALLQSEFPDAILVIAGQDAGAMDTLKAAIRRHRLDERVVFTGFLQGAEKRAAYALATVFALPSTHENFGVAVTEAMAHGTPVVVTSAVDSHVYVDVSRCGRTVQGTPEALAGGLREVLLADGAAMGQRGREFVMQNLSWHTVARQFDGLYAACAESAASPRSLAGVV